MRREINKDIYIDLNMDLFNLIRQKKEWAQGRAQTKTKNEYFILSSGFKPTQLFSSKY
jgi:hypothetical protein